LNKTVAFNMKAAVNCMVESKFITACSKNEEIFMKISSIALLLTLSVAALSLEATNWFKPTTPEAPRKEVAAVAEKAAETVAAAAPAAPAKEATK
jgi:hypothetical protein